MDFLLNGQAQGSIAQRLLHTGFDPGALRPYIGKGGHTYVTVNRNGKPTTIRTNANATLTKDQWIHLDRQIIKAARPRLKLWADLRATDTYTIPNGMGRMTLEHQTTSDPGEADTSMDAQRQTNRDRPLFDLTALPLPIHHAEFSFSARELAVARDSGAPLDTVMAEACARRVAEKVEKYAIGTASFAYGGASVYGVTSYPSRITRTILAPTDPAWTPARFIDDVLAMRQDSVDNYHFGPWRLYCSTAWDKYLDTDYSQAKGDNTLRARTRAIEGISDVRSLDYLTGYQLVLLQTDGTTARAVVGMELQTVQWEERGGMGIHFLVMCIQVPQFRKDFNDNCGLVHGNTA